MITLENKAVDGETAQRTEGSDSGNKYTNAERKELVRQNEARAQEILKNYNLGNKKKPNLLARVQKAVKRRKMVKFGSQNLPAGPDIYDADKIYVVEGRADVINLMKMGIDNTVAVGGTNVHASITHFCKGKEVTALLDGDRGGDMILKELLLKTEIDFVARAPKGREIEHLNMDEMTDLLENGVKKIKDAEFVDEKISLVSFLKRNRRYNYLK